jgi:hypothetical protein
VLDTLSRLITIFSRSLIVPPPRLVMSHHVLAIFLTAAYFSHRSSIFCILVPVGPPRLKIPKREREFDVRLP